MIVAASERLLHDAPTFTSPSDVMLPADRTPESEEAP
jgi:hypothetical protein